MTHKSKIIKPRYVSPRRKAVRHESDQPDIPSDIDQLVTNWDGSAEQKAFNKRFQVRNKKK